MILRRPTGWFDKAWLTGSKKFIKDWLIDLMKVWMIYSKQGMNVWVID